jgi:outer membrane protein TolC
MLRSRIANTFILIPLLIFFILLLIPAQADDETWDENTTNLIFIEQGDIEPPLLLYLDRAIDLALENNHEIEQLEFQLESAMAQLNGARRQYLPSLDFSLSSRISGPASSMNIPLSETQSLNFDFSTTDIINTGTLTLTQPVYMFGSIELANEIARFNVEQANLQLERARETLRRDVSEAYYHTALAMELVDIAQGSVETSEERLRISNVRFDAGDATRFDVLRSEVSLATAQEGLIQAETTSDLALSALEQKLGIDLGTYIIFPLTDIENRVFHLPELTLEEAQYLAMANRKDLLALVAAVNLLDRTADMQRNRPKLILQGNFSYADRTSGFSSNRESWSVFLNLSYNLFNGGRTDSAVDEAEANRDALNAKLEETRTLVLLEVESTMMEIANAFQRIEVTSATLESAREALRMAEIGYSEGVVTYIDYLDADQGLRQAETLHLQAVYAYMIADAKFRAAIGESID